MSNFHLDLNDETIAAEGLNHQETDAEGTIVSSASVVGLDTPALVANPFDDPQYNQAPLDAFPSSVNAYQIEPEQQASNKLPFAILTMVLVGGMVGGGLYFLDHIKGLFLDSASKVVTLAVQDARKAVAKVPVVEPPKLKELVPENPYWVMEKKLGQSMAPSGRIWLGVEEKSWRSALESKAYYSKYAVLNEIKKRRLRGSEVLLKELWLHMK